LIEVALTKVGQDLVNVCKAPDVGGFYGYVKEDWKDFLHESKPTEQSTAGNEDKPYI